MKKTLLFALIALFVSVAAEAQIPFTYYEPAGTPSSSSSNYQVPSVRMPSYSNSSPSYETIGAYFINNKGNFQRTKLKVNAVSSSYGGGTTVYVREYRDETYDMWHSMNSQATAINRYSNEPDVIKENFEWKCYVTNIGWVYFNY